MFSSPCKAVSSNFAISKARGSCARCGIAAPQPQPFIQFRFGSTADASPDHRAGRLCSGKRAGQGRPRPSSCGAAGLESARGRSGCRHRGGTPAGSRHARGKRVTSRPPAPISARAMPKEPERRRKPSEPEPRSAPKQPEPHPDLTRPQTGSKALRARSSAEPE